LVPIWRSLKVNLRVEKVVVEGPEPLVSAVRAAAEDLGVPKNRFHDEAFAFHSQ
jgi:ferredoxin-NADP reductase